MNKVYLSTNVEYFLFKEKVSAFFFVELNRNGVFTYVEKCGYGQDEAPGLKAIIVIHDKTLGLAIGGSSMWTYATEQKVN